VGQPARLSRRDLDNRAGCPTPSAPTMTPPGAEHGARPLPVALVDVPMPARRSALLSLLLLSLSSPILAQAPKRGPEPFKRLKFRNIGPAAGGRVCRAAGVPGDPLTYYAATASSGLWKSEDGGLSWKPIMDDMPTST